MPLSRLHFRIPATRLVSIVLPHLATGLDLNGWSQLLAAENLAVVIATAGCLVYLARRRWSVRRSVDTAVVYVPFRVGATFRFLPRRSDTIHS